MTAWFGSFWQAQGRRLDQVPLEGAGRWQRWTGYLCLAWENQTALFSGCFGPVEFFFGFVASKKKSKIVLLKSQNQACLPFLPVGGLVSAASS